MRVDTDSCRPAKREDGGETQTGRLEKQQSIRDLDVQARGRESATGAIGLSLG